MAELKKVYIVWVVEKDAEGSTVQVLAHEPVVARSAEAAKAVLLSTMTIPHGVDVSRLGLSVVEVTIA